MPFTLIFTITLVACNRSESIKVPEAIAASPESRDQVAEAAKGEENNQGSGPSPGDEDSKPIPDLPEPTTPIPMDTKPEVPVLIPPEPVVEPPKPVEPEPILVKKYRIIGYGSNRCLTAPENVGVQFEIRDCADSSEQAFTMESLGNSVMKIVTHKNHVMEIRGGNLVDGGIVQSAVYGNKATQKWGVGPKNFSGFESLNVFNSFHTLDAYENGTANGTKIQIWRTEAPNPNQRWMVQEL